MAVSICIGFMQKIDIESHLSIYPMNTLLYIEDLYMSAHILLNLLNELANRDKMRGLSGILFLFRNEFNKFNNTRARMYDSFYHMTFNKITLKSHFCRKNVITLSLCTQRYNGRHNVSRKSVNHYYCIKSCVERYLQPCFNRQKPMH